MADTDCRDSTGPTDDSDGDSDGEDFIANTCKETFHKFVSTLPWTNSNYRIISKVCSALSLSERDCDFLIKSVRCS